jgi:hypothetical protein
MTWPRNLTVPTSRVHLVGAVRFPRPITPVVEKSSRLALLTITSAILALRFDVPIIIRLGVLVSVAVLLVIVDETPSISRNVALTVCALAGLGATWIDPHRGVSSSIDIAVSSVGAGMVLLAAWQIQRGQLPPIMCSALVGLASSTRRWCSPWCSSSSQGWSYEHITSAASVAQSRS